MESREHNFDSLLKIMDELREKCPWDKKQTIHTLRQQTIEELYELTDDVTEENWKGMCEELGDLLLHVIFYAKIGEEQNQFNINDVIDGICKKLIARHPHIYGNVKADTEEEVKRNWEKLKLKEGKSSVLSGVPKALPALVKAIRLQEKAKQVGFEWENPKQVWDKVEEETEELQEAIRLHDRENMEEELGDLLFSIVNYSRFLHIDAENALERTNKKFIYRFQKMEEEAKKSGTSLSELNLMEMDALWTKIKNI